MNEMAEGKVCEVLSVENIFQAIEDGVENDIIVNFIKEFDCPETIKDEGGNGLLFWCICNDKLQLMSDLLALGRLPVNEYTPNSSLLFYSLIEDKYEFAVKLIEAGADVNTSNHKGKVPLHLALDSEYKRLLLENGATATINNYDNSGMTPLHYAITEEDAEVVQLLLHYGADTDLTCSNGNTPFITALITGVTELQDLLLEFECDFNRKTKSGYLLQEAIWSESSFVLEIINRGADIKTGNVFQWCLDTDNFDAFKDFWQKKAFLTEYYHSDVLYAVTTRIAFIPYLEYILESDELEEAVQYTDTNNLITSLLKLTENGYSRELAEKAVYIFLSYGVTFSQCDLEYIYNEYKTEDYEPDSFFRDLLFMYNDEIVTGDRSILVQLLFSTAKSINDIIEMYLNVTPQQRFIRRMLNGNLIKQLLRYMRHSELYQDVLYYEGKTNNNHGTNWSLENFNDPPSLSEFARNQVRHYVHSNFKIRNASHFYSIVENLPLPTSIIEVVEFRRHLY